MLSICEECKSHGLEQNDFNKRKDDINENDGDISSSPDSDGDDDAVYKCGALRDLVPFVQFKKREKHPWRSMFFKLCTWY